jgi:hypothetical protein
MTTIGLVFKIYQHDPTFYIHSKLRFHVLYIYIINLILITSLSYFLFTSVDVKIH